VRPSLYAQLRTFPAPVWVLFLGTFINRFGTFVMPFLVLYVARLGYSPSRAGLALGAYGSGHLIASLAGGHLADSIGRRNTIAVSMFCSALAMLALSQVHAYWSIVTLTTIAGFAAELYRPASAALLGDLLPPEQRTTGFGMYRFAVNLGFAAGPATAGFLADRSFLLIFVFDAVSSLAFGLIALAFLPHGLRTMTEDERFTDALHVARKDKAFMLFLAATVLVTIVDFQTGSTFPLWVARCGFRPTTYGMLLSLNGLLIITLELMITAWTQRQPQRRMISIGYLLSGLGVAATGLAHTIPALAATVVIWTFGEMIASPVTGAYVSHLAPERYRGRYNGLWVLAWALGLIIGPSIGTFVFQYNPAALWIACAALGVAAFTLARWPVSTPRPE
jgi:MFS family permease